MVIELDKDQRTTMSFVVRKFLETDTVQGEDLNTLEGIYYRVKYSSYDTKDFDFSLKELQLIQKAIDHLYKQFTQGTHPSWLDFRDRVDSYVDILKGLTDQTDTIEQQDITGI